MRFFSIKKPDGSYDGMFIAEDKSTAKEIAKTHGFIKEGEDPVMEDVTVEMTEADKIKNKVTRSE